MVEINRRIGGLETIHCHGAESHGINRRIGGLEKNNNNQTTTKQINRRIGGLETKRKAVKDWSRKLTAE